MKQATVLVVEDDPSLQEALCDTLEMSGYRVESAADGEAALKVMEKKSVGMVVSDVQMRPMDGNELLTRIKSRYPSIPVLLMTAYGDIEKAVTAMQHGAIDYLAKPFDEGALLRKVDQSVQYPQDYDNDVVAQDPVSLELLQLAQRVAHSDATVMVAGESGTGKEVIARYIHRNSKRSKGPFVAINCAAIPDNMLEAVLFGYEKGAFTGALRAVPGKFEQAQNGTLLLDEISEMSLGLQAKLLRVLQEREVERLGSHKTIALDVRVLATSNRNLRDEVTANRFREDLFFRLNVFPLQLKPLRQRQQDILPLAEYLIGCICSSRAGGALALSAVAKRRLQSHTWPGNVRELENVLQRAVILCEGDEIGVEALTFEMESSEEPTADDDGARSKLNDDLRTVEEKLILDALRADNGNRKSVAERLGISQRTLRYKIARLRESGVAIPG